MFTQINLGDANAIQAVIEDLIQLPLQKCFMLFDTPQGILPGLHLLLQKDVVFLKPHLPFTCSCLGYLRVSQMAVVPVFKQSNLAPFSSAMGKQCSSSV